MAKQKPSQGRGKGRPAKPSKANEIAINVAVPTWLRSLIDDARRKEGREIKEEVQRRLKESFGLNPWAESPDDKKQ